MTSFAEVRSELTWKQARNESDRSCQPPYSLIGGHTHAHMLDTWQAVGEGCSPAFEDSSSPDRLMCQRPVVELFQRCVARLLELFRSGHWRSWKPMPFANLHQE